MRARYNTSFTDAGIRKAPIALKECQVWGVSSRACVRFACVLTFSINQLLLLPRGADSVRQGHLMLPIPPI